MTDENQVAQEAAQDQEQTQEAVLQIQRIYVKDVSFEAPNLPNIFQQEWKPNLEFNLGTEAKQLGDDLYEVTLNLTVETTLEDSGDLAFICEVKQAGVFTISGLEDMHMAHALTSRCPEMLFPYARELVASMVNRGTFPPLNLAPVNFDALFLEHMRRVEEEEQAQPQAESQPTLN